MATQNNWPVEQYAAMNPEFFEEAVPVELPALTWRDIEHLADEVPDELVAAPAREEPEQEEEQPNERALKNRDIQARNQRYSAIDEQLTSVVVSDDLFALSPFMARDVRAFRAVIDSYLSERYKSGTKTMNYSGAGHGTRRAFKPLRLDFICDVELTAKKALNLAPKMQKQFQKYILENEGETWNQVSMYLRNRIETLVGKAFVKAGLYPLGRYFNE